MPDQTYKPQVVALTLDQIIHLVASGTGLDVPTVRSVVVDLNGLGLLAKEAR